MGRSLALLAVVVAMAAAACGGSDANERYLPRTIVHEDAGRSFPSGPCASWLSPGIDAAFCATGAEVPSNDRPGDGQVEFTGTPRAGTEGEMAQAAGALPEGRPIGIKINTSTEGTIVAQGICGRTLVRATFLRVRFNAGDSARLDVTQIGDTPVILMRHNGRTLPPRREVLVDLGWMSLLAPDGCAFRVS